MRYSIVENGILYVVGVMILVEFKYSVGTRNPQNLNQKTEFFFHGGWSDPSYYIMREVSEYG